MLQWKAHYVLDALLGKAPTPPSMHDDKSLRPTIEKQPRKFHEYVLMHGLHSTLQDIVIAFVLSALPKLPLPLLLLWIQEMSDKEQTHETEAPSSQMEVIHEGTNTPLAHAEAHYDRVWCMSRGFMNLMVNNTFENTIVHNALQISGVNLSKYRRYGTLVPMWFARPLSESELPPSIGSKLVKKRREALVLKASFGKAEHATCGTSSLKMNHQHLFQTRVFVFKLRSLQN